MRKADEISFSRHHLNHSAFFVSHHCFLAHSSCIAIAPAVMQIIALLLFFIFTLFSMSFALRRSAPGMVASFRIMGTRRMLASGSSSGSIGEDTVVARCTKKITDALQPTRLKVSAAHDDPNGSHIAIEIVSSQFEGKSSMLRQRLVYKAIWDEMSGPVHAVDQIIAKTPAEDSG